MEGLQYRLAALSGATIGIFYGLINITVLTIFYTRSDNPQAGIAAGLTLADAVSYVWLAQFLVYMQFFAIDSELGQKIVNGDIGLELCRPMDLYGHWFAKSAASKVAPMILRSIPVVIVSVCLPMAYRLMPPASVWGLICMVISAASGFFLCVSYGMLMTAMRINVPWGDGPMYVMALVGNLMSGLYLPLRLWPDALQTFLRYQPFAGYLDLPVQFYIGTIDPTHLSEVLLIQWTWTAFFILLGRWIMKRQLRKIIVQGG